MIDESAQAEAPAAPATTTTEAPGAISDTEHAAAVAALTAPDADAPESARSDAAADTSSGERSGVSGVATLGGAYQEPHHGIANLVSQLPYLIAQAASHEMGTVRDHLMRALKQAVADFDDALMVIEGKRR